MTGDDSHDWSRPAEGARALLARIDERTRLMDERLQRVEETMVTSKEFTPFKVGVFAVIGSIVTAFGTALYAAVFHTKGGPP